MRREKIYDADSSVICKWGKIPSLVAGDDTCKESEKKLAKLTVKAACKY